MRTPETIDLGYSARVPIDIEPSEAHRYRELGWWRDSTIADDFAAAVARDPNKPAIHSSRAAGNSEVLTYAELDERVDSIAVLLLELGVCPGEIVSFQLPNWWEFAALHLACARIGAVTNPISPILRRRELQFILAQTGSRVCIVPDRYRKCLHGELVLEVRRSVSTLERVCVIGHDIPEGAVDFNASMREIMQRLPLARVLPRIPVNLADTAGQVQFTSGTTGVPKGVVHTYNTLALSARAVPEVLGLTEHDVVLMSSPLAHNTGFMYGMSMPLMYGMTTVFQDTWDPAVALELIRSERVTFTMGSTAFLLDLCNAIDPAEHDVSSLRFFVCGGAPIPPLAAKLCAERLGVPLITSWGLTENGIATMTDIHDDPRESDGRPLPWVQVRIADEQGTELADGVPGRLLVKAANEHRTYLDRQDLHEQSFFDGWFDTGDVARRRPDGTIRITGRMKDVLIRAGENVPVLEVEAALLETGLVADIAIVGIPDERLGERACAVVVPAPGIVGLKLDDLTARLEELGMAIQYWPERLELRAELPRTASGKVQKYVLRGELAPEQAAGPT